jgi:hypothetical protein
VENILLRFDDPNMPKIHVVIDTNIYRKNPSRTDLSFQALERLCKQGIVKLHLPYVVEREFQTQQKSQYEKEFDSAIGGMNAVIRKGMSAEQITKVESICDELKATIPAILAEVEASLPLWVESIGGQRHAITEEQAVAAMESYFLGKHPLKSPKVRDDIPDSFIYQTIVKLSASSKPLVVVAEDGKIAEASEALADVAVYRSLSAFIESEAIQSEILDLDVVENRSVIRDEISKYEAKSDEISALIRREGCDKLDGETISSRSIPDDNHEATITGGYDPENVELDFDELSYFGQGKFGIPFTFTTTVSIIYYIFKADFYSIDEDRMPSVSYHNDHYFEAQDETEVQVYGIVKLSIDPDALKSISAEVLADGLEISIDSIDKVEVIE